MRKEDWDVWDIKSALGKRGYTLTMISKECGFARKTIAHDVLRKQFPRVEQVVADILGVEPWDIWPSRYDENRQPKRRRMENSARKVKPKVYRDRVFECEKKIAALVIEYGDAGEKAVAKINAQVELSRRLPEQARPGAPTPGLKDNS
ncbi:MAG: helix-turn-helix domain-containing protein [Desulfobulbaceae bacterium]|jgi:Ner family transcriptional regulator